MSEGRAPRMDERGWGGSGRVRESYSLEKLIPGRRQAIKGSIGTKEEYENKFIPRYSTI